MSTPRSGTNRDLLKEMRILSIYRYYLPDSAPYGKILAPILERMAEVGHKVVVLTGQPSYNSSEKRPWNEKINGVDVSRVWLFPENRKRPILRALNFVLFLIMTTLHALMRRYDLLIVNSYPPILMGFTARVISTLTAIPYIYHCQDIHPESALAAGYLKKNFIYFLLRRIDTGACNNASAVVTLSHDMASTLIERGVKANRIIIRNNLMTDVFENCDVVPDGFPVSNDDDFLLLYAGNIGKFQGIDNIIEAARILRSDKNIKFIFMGSGIALNDIKRQATEMIDKTVFFVSYQSTHIVANAVHRADFGVVSLQKGIYRVAYPSKTMVYLAEGCPFIAIVEEESILAEETTSRGFGYSCRPTDPQKLAEVILRARRDKDVWRQKRSEIRENAQRQFGRKEALVFWSALIDRIGKNSAREKGGISF
jgi:colanic acid biosynthesis glycosyl transferase WcaI